MTALAPALFVALALSASDPDAPARPDPSSSMGAPEPSGWFQWRGPTRDGRYQGPAWPAELDGERLRVLWKTEDLGPSYAGPIVTGSRVFTVETAEAEREVVRALDRATGEEVWTAAWEGAIEVPFFAARNGSWVRATPAFDPGADGGSLYVAGMRDVLVCLNAETGETRWSVDFVERHGTPLPSFGFVSSPLVLGDHVYVQAGAAFEKLDKRTGETVWRTMNDRGGMESAFSSPVLARLNGRDQLVVLSRAELAGVVPEDGSVLWSTPIKAFRGMNILTPLTHGEDAVFTAPYGGRAQLLRLVPDDGGVEVSTEWENRAQGYMTSPVIVDGHAYFFLRSNRFACVNLETGEDAWISPPTGDDYWSLVAQGDRILALANTGILRLVAASPEGYEVLGETQVSDDPTWAHLAAAGDQLFVRGLHSALALEWR